MTGQVLTSIACAIRGDKPDPLPYTLEELLLFLTRFGKPRCGMFGTGWSCQVEMHVVSVGTSFEVKSDFGMETPLAAAKQCAERLIETLTKLGVKP